MSQLCNRVIVARACVCVCVCLCGSALASSDALDEEEVDALCEVGNVVLIQTKLSATQGLLSNDRGPSTDAKVKLKAMMPATHNARLDAFKISWFIFIGLWMLGAIAWQLRATSQTLPQTTSESSATPASCESLIESLIEQAGTFQAQQSPKSTRSRDTKIDEVRFYLRALVFFAYFIRLQFYRPSFRTVHNTLTSFHVPAFIIMSGMFSKSQISPMQPDVRQTKLKTMTIDLLGAFLMEGVVRGVVEMMTFGSVSSFSFQQLFSGPPGPWFILAIFWYRLVWCPISTLFDPRARIPVSIFCAVVCMRNTDMPISLFALRDTIYYLPFFQMGMHLSEDDLIRFSHPLMACASFLIFFFVLPFLRLQTSAGPWIDMLTRREPVPADEGGVFADVAIYGVRFGLCMLALGLLLRIAQIGGTTRIGKAMHSMLAGLGTRTLYAYVLQKALWMPPKLELISFLNNSPSPESWIPLMLLLALMVNALFCSEFTKVMFWWICQPSYLFSYTPPVAEKSATITGA